MLLPDICKSKLFGKCNPVFCDICLALYSVHPFSPLHWMHSTLSILLMHFYLTWIHVNGNGSCSTMPINPLIPFYSTDHCIRIHIADLTERSDRIAPRLTVNFRRLSTNSLYQLDMVKMIITQKSFLSFSFHVRILPLKRKGTP